MVTTTMPASMACFEDGLMLSTGTTQMASNALGDEVLMIVASVSAGPWKAFMPVSGVLDAGFHADEPGLVASWGRRRSCSCCPLRRPSRRGWTRIFAVSPAGAEGEGNMTCGDEAVAEAASGVSLCVVNIC